MINAYGPTETTVCATMSEPLSGAVVPRLGTTLGGSAVYVLDASLRECGPDVPGELCVAGPSLAPGYLGRPDLTAQRFVANPFGPPGSRMDRAGDLAIRRADGSLHFLGRIDDQVKIRGFLVEPHEVEQVMLNHPAVAQAAVVPRPGPGGDLQLIGYASLITHSGEDAASLRRYVGTHLPSYWSLRTSPFSMPCLSPTMARSTAPRCRHSYPAPAAARRGQRAHARKRSWPPYMPACSAWNGSVHTTASSTWADIRCQPFSS